MRRAIGLSLSALILAVLGYTSVIQVEGNLLSDRVEQRDSALARIIFPQGWNLFTKPPTDPFFMMYEVRDDGSLDLRTHESSSPEAGFGLSRDMRARGLEVGHLGPQLATDELWTTCETPTEECLEYSDEAAVQVTKPVEDAEFCGSYVMAEKTVTPRAYRQITDQRYSVDRMVSLSIECTESA